ncbi:MAG: Aspartokinase [Thermoproteota archaeon]|nr:Aspartokinase [Thermoproteota archaeon]
MGNSILVVKFGGSCLSTSDNILFAARKISTEVSRGKKVVVVVSALSGVTDDLLSLAKKSTMNNVTQEDLDEILSMGERTAVRLMSSALRSLGFEARGIDPLSNLWPILTDSNFGNAEVNLEETVRATKERILPLISNGYIPVFAGFIGLSPKGKITTLGRGGSDITAMVLGNVLDSEEVVFVKDVGGVLSADPKRVSSPQKIDFLEAEEAYTLASAGAKVIQPKALMYKKNSTILRVVGFDDRDLSGGTVITGELKSGLNIELYNSSLSMITLIVQEASSPEVILKILAEASASNTRVLGVTVSPPSILLYVQNPSDLVQRLHEMIKSQSIAKAIHSFDSLAMITVSGHGLERSPGIIDIIVEPLAKEHINLYGVLTISSSIKIFVPWRDRERVLPLIDNNLNSIKNSGGNQNGRR